MRIQFLSAVAALCILAGCVATPTSLTIVERGAKPDLDPSLKLVHQHLKRTLRDYDSIKDFTVKHGEIYPISATNLGYNFEQAWMLCVEYNAKNSYGAYVGIQPHGFPLRVDEAGMPFLVSTINWRTHANGSCN